jgi:hypothetical protein
MIVTLRKSLLIVALAVAAALLVYAHGAQSQHRQMSVSAVPSSY